MINIYNKIYVQLDNYIASSTGQKRVILTDRSYPHEFPKDPEMLRLMGVTAYISSEEELVENYESLDGLLTHLVAMDEKIVIITNQHYAVRLLVMHWKSLFEKAGIQDMYKLYRYFVYNENLFFAYLKDHDNVDGLMEDRYVTTMTLEAFSEIANEQEHTITINPRNPTIIPVEYLLANYLSGEITENQKYVFFNKVRSIVMTNLIGLIDNDRQNFFRYSHNHYLLTGADPAQDIEDPLYTLKNTPSLSWLFDREIHQSNVRGTLRKYGLEGIKEMFAAYNKLFSKGSRFYEAESALDFLINDDIAGLIEFDIADDNSNFFTEREFMRKVNGLLVSHFYQLARHNRVSELKAYKLKD